MSHRIVERVIGRLLTDEEFRHEFLRGPKETLAALAEQGWDLTGVEVEALLHTDASLWSMASARIDRRLRRSSLKTGEVGQEPR